MKYNVFVNDTEQSMVQLIQQGCQSTFGKLYDQYAPVLFGVITKIISNEKTSSEILQKAFVKIWKVKDNFDLSRHSIFTWMIKIVREIINTDYTVASKENQNYANLVYIKPAEIFSKQKDQIIPGSINKEDKEILDLVYFKGYSFTEAAMLLNIALDTLKTKVKMAVKKLNATVTTA